MPRVALPLDDPFGQFSISTHTYKVVDGHEVLADVLIPKKLLQLGSESEEWKKARPVSVRVHGGGLVTGKRTDPSFVPRWLYPFAHEHNAIIVSPDYRLLPEATAEELLDDLDDFWIWLGCDLPGVVHDVSVNAVVADREVTTTSESSIKGLKVDLDRVLVHGESAGGYCALQMVLSNFKPQISRKNEFATETQNQTPRIRALVAVYPMCDFRHPHWTQAYLKDVNGAPQLPVSTIDDHLAAIRDVPAPRRIVSSAENSDPRGMLFLAAVQQGRLNDLLGPERAGESSRGSRIHIEDRLAAGAKLPPTLLVHGTADSGVPVECADRLAALVREGGIVVNPEDMRKTEGWEPLLYARVEGEEHGFDLDLGPEDAEWVKKGLDFIEKAWLEVD